MCKILHLDDSHLQQTLVQRIFDKNTYDTFILQSAYSIAEALNLLKKEHFDIIIADLNLPDSTRENTVKTLKKNFPYTPIIAISCEEDIEIVLQAIRDGVDCFINKNWELKQLPYTVLTILEKNKIIEQAKDTITNSIKEQSKAMVRSLTDGLERTMSLSRATSSKLKLLKEQRALYG